MVQMANAAGSTTFYEFDSTELLELYKEMWDNDEEPVVVYHSHTATEAYPSRTDIGLASEPNAHYVLVSTREHGNSEGPVEFRSYRIVDGEVTEEEVTRRATTRPSRTPAERPTWARPHQHRIPCTPASRSENTMAIEVRIPTILRTYTDGAKAVNGEGATLPALIDDLEAQPLRHQGPSRRTRRRTCAASSTSTSTTRTSASPAGSAPRSATATRSSCCPRSQAVPDTPPAHALRQPPRLRRRHPPHRAAAALAVP